MKLYLHIIKLIMKSKTTYPFAFVVEIFANIINVGAFYIFLMTIFSRTTTIGGWKYEEVLVLVGLNWLANAICGFFFYGPSVHLGEYVRSGELDTFLIRPIKPLKYLVFRQFQYSFIGRLLLSSFFLVIGLVGLEMQWTWWQPLFLLVTLISGVFIHAAILLIFSVSAFWLVNNRNVMNLVVSYDGIRTLTDFPLNIFPIGIQLFFSLVLPYGFVNYYPVILLFGKSQMVNGFDLKYLGLLSLPVGLILFYLAVKIWYIGLRKYASSGS